MRGLKPSIWNEKERHGEEKSRTGSESGRKGVGYPQRKCLFDSVAAKLLSAGKRIPEMPKEHHRASKQLLLQRQEKPKVKQEKLHVTVELDMPVVFGILHPIHYDRHTFPLVICQFKCSSAIIFLSHSFGRVVLLKPL